ncbi:MAG: hypothetical protein QGI21_05645 [Candidatus Poseidoniaceae archaeon]|jgi:hypothetical protein|nr:hypothetical protein [Candidatus Poseidoniaceae archaeon]
MKTEHLRIVILSGLVLCSTLIVAYPVELVLNTDVIFEDETMARIESESISEVEQEGQLLLVIKHDNGSSLTGDFQFIERLMQIERELLDGSNSSTSWVSEEVVISKLETPFNFWAKAFESRNRSLENANQWSDVLQPPLEEGWCGDNSTEAEQQAFESTLLLLPKDSNFGVACPSFPGADAEQPPDPDEMLWLVWLKSEGGDTDWNSLNIWAEKVSDSTEFEFEAVGVNMLFAKSKVIAKNDINNVMIPSIFALAIVLVVILRDWKVSVATLGGVVLVICAEAGLLSALGKSMSIVDAIAFPIVLAVAVDGAFWYCKSSRSKEEVRSILLMAMATTLAAISLAMISPLKAQSSLAMVMAIGIILSWIVTRFVLEDFFLNSRRISTNENELKESIFTNKSAIWSWPIALLLLASIAIISPNGVEVFDVNQFLPEDDPALGEFDELQSKYIIASSTVTWVVVNTEGDSTDDFQAIVDFQKQLGNHPSVISFETGIMKSPLVMGITTNSQGLTNSTFDQVSQYSYGSPIMDDHRLQSSGKTTGIAIALFIDGSNADAALQLMEDIDYLLDSSNLSGEVGGDLVVGSSLARDFEDSRVTQILAAGFAVFFVSAIITGNPQRSLRIAIGTIAIGAAVDGMASMIGERGVSTAPAVLLGMGFAADYLSHASANHVTTRNDNFARWGAAITSVSVFILLSFATFPPARETGQLLGMSILFSVTLATCLAINLSNFSLTDSEE